MFPRSRSLRLFVAAVYLALIIGAALFHTDHGDGHHPAGYCQGERAPLADSPLAFAPEGGCTHGAGPFLRASGHFGHPAEVCPVCQFLAQKPLPQQDVRHVQCSPLEQEPLLATPPLVPIRTELAWHSRAPPAVA